MTKWVRFRANGAIGFGTIAHSDIAVHDGDMFGANKPTGQTLQLGDVELLAPCAPVARSSGCGIIFTRSPPSCNQPDPAGAVVFPESAVQRRGARRGGARGPPPMTARWCTKANSAS